MTNSIPEVQETVNSALIGILTGVKNVGGEIYDASKDNIAKAIDFAMEQAPQVIQEFLTWRMTNAMIDFTIAVVVISILGYIFYKLLKHLKSLGKDISFDDQMTTSTGLFFCVLISVMMVCAFLIPSTKEMVKIKVAPRIYLIEWVNNTVHGR